MKSLTIFLVTIVLFTCLVKSSVTEGEASPKKSQKGNSPSKPAIRLQAEVKRNARPGQRKSSLDFSDTDKLVCGNGQYLGNLSSSQSCRSLHYNKCKEMVRRDKNAPQTKSTASERISSLSTDSVIRKRQLKKWRLRRRAKRRAQAKVKSQRKNPVKLPVRVRRQLRMRKAAEQFLNRMLSRKNRNMTKKNVDKIAKSLGKNKMPSISNQKQKIKKMLSSSEAKRLKARKMEDKTALAKIITSNPGSSPSLKRETDLQNGNFCVHAVVWNINYCCFFNNKPVAQEFANSQPKEELFQQLLHQGRLAEKKDKERRTKKKAGVARKMLRKIDSKNKARRQAAAGIKSKKSNKYSSKKSNKSKSGKKSKI
jgi:hypothetical protein